MSDKINEIRARHEEGIRAGANEDRAYLLAEVDRQRDEIERLREEDTKTRHALKGWVFVCPDGGDEPTHERVAAVVAEVDRQRAENEALHAALKRRDAERLIERMSPSEKMGILDRLEAQERRRRKALECKP